MSSKKTTVKLKILSEGLAAANGLEVGEVIEVPANGGIITDAYWRARFHDSTFDNCVEVVKNATKSTKTSE